MFSGCVVGCIKRKNLCNPYNEQLERMKKAVGADSDTALAGYLGITQGSMSGAKAKRKIPLAWFFLVSDKTGISVDFLYSGNAKGGQGDAEQQSDVPNSCQGCVILERQMLQERQERQFLSRENGELKVQIARLEERLKAVSGRGNEPVAAPRASIA